LLTNTWQKVVSSEIQQCE